MGFVSEKNLRENLLRFPGVFVDCCSENWGLTIKKNEGGGGT